LRTPENVGKNVVLSNELPDGSLSTMRNLTGFVVCIVHCLVGSKITGGVEIKKRL
jgi:hypothetical protein